MDKVKTTVIIGIVLIVLLAVLIFLNRDKFARNKNTVTTTEETVEE